MLSCKHALLSRESRLPPSLPFGMHGDSPLPASLCLQDLGVAVASVTGVDLDHLNAAFPNTYMPPLGDVGHQ
jgi:hypothetical protein